MTRSSNAWQRLLFLSVVLCAGCHKPKLRTGSGDEWRSWTPEKRQTFVAGYLDGVQSAQYQLCENLDKEVLVFKLREPDPNVLNPCDQLKVGYSHSGGLWDRAGFTKAYVSVIDDFYKHPDCREMPYSALLEHLNDKEYKSGEDLYKLVHHGGAEWGSFEIDEDFDKCYP